MPHYISLGRWPWRLSALLSVLLLAGTAWLVGPRPAQATQDHPLTDWLQGQAKPLATTDPDAPLDDLQPLDRLVGDAVIAGLGESTHGAKKAGTGNFRSAPAVWVIDNGKPALARDNPRDNHETSAAKHPQ